MREKKKKKEKERERERIWDVVHFRTIFHLLPFTSGGSQMGEK
ncbi:MAG: hypothetical protein ACTS45_00485 [Candidatus Hodgkinia cicadicola]